MKQKLDRQRASDNLKKNLEHRAERDELVERRFPSSISAYVMALGCVEVLSICTNWIRFCRSHPPR